MSPRLIRVIGCAYFHIKAGHRGGLFRTALMCTVLGTAALCLDPGRAVAQSNSPDDTAAQIRAIEQQIHQLQSQLSNVRKELVSRQAEVQAARQDAARARQEAQQAKASAQIAAAAPRVQAAPTAGSGHGARVASTASAWFRL